MVEAQEELLNVRETARRLGVHENTVRNWAREGLLPDARVPGSRYLRFRTIDVERLLGQRGARTVPSLQRERLTVRPDLATAGDLNLWANARARDAQANFPELMRRLLAETPGITNASVRAGDGVALAGYDGIANSSGTPFLPAGRLVLEFGTEQRPATKAENDYNNRKPAAPTASVFVFATPRRWGGASAWAMQKQAEGLFADVRVIDADDLEGWLQNAPGAHHWISEHLGLQPRGATSLDQWWESFASSTSPRLPDELFLAGRTVQADELCRRVAGPAAVTVIQTEWARDAVAFTYAALTRMPELGEPPIGTPIVVTTRDAWEPIIDAAGTSLLIPTFEEPELSRAVAKGHHVIAVMDQSVAARRNPDIVLPRIGRNEADAALRAAGLDFERASRLAALGRRSLPALCRELSIDPRVTRPQWSQGPQATHLAPLMLVGSWTDGTEDRQVVERAVAVPYESLEPTLNRLSRTSDPLLRRIGSAWQFASPEEAFILLRDSLTSDSLDRVLTIAIEVLSEPDPVQALSREERLMAGVRGVRRPHSEQLRTGLAQGLALLGTIGSDVLLPDGSTLAKRARRAVEKLFDKANADLSGSTWTNLADVLRALAEAAPDEFLAAVLDDLVREHPAVLALFQDDSTADQLFAPSSPHPQLLWALETLCWSPTYLSDAARALALLGSRDRGGRLANRPLASLAAVLCGWVRQTSANLEERIDALDVVFASAEGVGWDLTLSLWPSIHSSTSAPAAPRFRDDWRPTSTTVPITDWIDFIHALVDRAIAHAGVDPYRLGQLVDGMAALPSTERDRILDFVERLTSEHQLGADAHRELWTRLRALSARHESFSDAEWAMPEGARKRLAALVEFIEPTSDPQRLAYLFGGRVELSSTDRRDFQARRAELERLRESALRGIIGGADKSQALARFTEATQTPALVGATLAELADVDLDDLLPWLTSPRPALIAAATAWVDRTAAKEGSAWLADVLRRPEIEDDARRLIISHAPPTRGTWDVLEKSTCTSDVDTYWENAELDVVDAADASMAIDRLICHERAWSAVTVAFHALYSVIHESAPEDTGPDRTLIVRLLDAALKQRPDRGVGSPSIDYELGTLLDFLATFPELEETVARYEFGFFRVLEHSRRPQALGRALAGQPDIFVQLASLAFRARNEPPRTLTEEEQARATHAYTVLHEWHGVPGADEDGVINATSLRSWVTRARLQFSELDRSDIGDELIGEALARCAAGDDGAWPAGPVRDLVETLGSRELENGIAIGKLNSRGVTSRDPFDGGTQERALAAQFEEWSKELRSKWPRTARILRNIAESYEQDARQEDLRAEFDADRG